MKMKLTKILGCNPRLYLSMMTLVLCFSMSAQSVIAQNVITGSVVDENNLALIGATILENGTTNGVSADNEGIFSITVNKGATLTVSFIGYLSKEIVVGNQTRINVKLDPDAEMLDAVVTIGYGSQRKEDLSTSVSVLKVDESMKGRPQDLGTLLQGRLPGLTIQKSGGPNNPSSFTIRGQGSRDSDQGVLFVVNGVPNAPYIVSDIETITVLKDAASAAIYGASVGSSGVILITTKKAEVGKIRVSANVTIGAQSATSLPSVLTAPEWNKVWAKAVANEPNAQLPNAANPETYPFGNVHRTDWLDEIYRTALTQQYNVSISGGTEHVQSLLSLSYENNEGVLLNTYYNKINANSVTTFNITDWLKITERISFQHANGLTSVNTSHEGPIMGALWYPSSAPIYEMNQDGSHFLSDTGDKVFGGTSPRWAAVSGYPNIYNPVAYLTRMNQDNPDNELLSTTSIEIRPITSLVIKSEFTAGQEYGSQDQFSAEMTEVGRQRDENFRWQRFYTNTRMLWETTASWAQVFNGHHISALAGYTMDYKKWGDHQVSTKNYSSEDPYNLVWNAAQPDGNPSMGISEVSMMSALARVGYSYKDRYFVVGSIRRDASSKLPTNNNADYFPAVSGSWKISSENFFNSKVIDLLKIRGSWGKVGNVDIFPTSAVNVSITSENDPIPMGEGQEGSLYPQYYKTIANYEARWEVTEQIGIGLDLSMFGNKLDFIADVYKKTTRDLIDRKALPIHYGIVDAPMANLGEVVNQGFEVSINYNGGSGDFKYNVWGMYNYNKGWVEEYGDLSEPMEHGSPNLDSRPILYSYKDQPWHSFRVFETAGIFRTQAQLDAHTHNGVPLQPNARLGDLIYVDTNKDGVINADDREFMGSYAPVSTFSLGGSINWKGFDLNLMFQGVTGNKVYNGLKQMGLNGRDGTGNLLSDVLDSWDFNEANSKYPRLGLAADDNGNYSNFTDIFLEDGDYLRLKNVTLGYTLPQKASRSIGMDNGTIRFFASLDNVFTITGYSGLDPEVGNLGIDRGVYPLTRSFNFGINIDF